MHTSVVGTGMGVKVGEKASNLAVAVIKRLEHSLGPFRFVMCEPSDHTECVKIQWSTCMNAVVMAGSVVHETCPTNDWVSLSQCLTIQ